jgi:methylated-DNA-[protein]-cysteine S-methyltransferase
MNQTYYTIVSSPIDDLLLVSDGTVLTGLYMETGAAAQPAGKKDAGPFREVTRQLSAYFEGDLRQFDLPIRLEGTKFQQTVWAALQELQFGQRISYGELARRIGQPNASRAVGLANGRNPVSIIVPCHRVIGASGSLVGYGGGLDRKRWLLEHEITKETGHCLQLTLT